MKHYNDNNKGEIKPTPKRALLPLEKVYKIVPHDTGKQGGFYGICRVDTAKNIEASPYVCDLNIDEAKRQLKVFNEDARSEFGKFLRIGWYDIDDEKYEEYSTEDISLDIVGNDDYNFLLLEPQVELINKVFDYIKSIENLVSDKEECLAHVWSHYGRREKIIIISLLICAVEEFEQETGIKFFTDHGDLERMNTLKMFYFIDNDERCAMELIIQARFQQSKHLKLFTKILKKHLAYVKSSRRPKLGKSDKRNNESHLNAFNENHIDPFSPVGKREKYVGECHVSYCMFDMSEED